MAVKTVKVKNRASAHFIHSSPKPALSKSSHSIFQDVVGVAEALLHSQKTYGAGKLHEIADATRGYAASMPDLPMINEKINVTSGTIDNLANYIVYRNMEQMFVDANALRVADL